MEYANLVTSDSMVFDRSRKKEPLNGPWNYGIDQYDHFLEGNWQNEKATDRNGFSLPLDYSFDEWPLMNLPVCWNLYEKELKLYDGSIVFTRKFEYIPKEENERVILKIGAANYLARVYLNKQFLGMHLGGSTPFYFDITEYIDRRNRLVIQVDSTRRESQVPTLATDWFNYGGVYRDIEIFRVPNTYIKDFRISLEPNSSFKKIRASVTISDKTNGTALLSIDELNIKEDITVRDGYGEILFDTEPELWSPENPKLYTATVSYGNDEITDKVGFREIKVDGMNIMLNGESIFLRGVCAHEESVKNGKALTDEERIENIMLAKELGCNFMRVAHYPHSERMAQLADEYGIMLWEEIPVYWHIAFKNEDTYKDAENQLAELIKRDYNRASVIIWSVGNENPDTDERYEFMGKLVDFAHAADKTRPVSAACLVFHNAIADRLEKHLDIIGVNEYIGWYTPNFKLLTEFFENSKPTKPVIITEFGADALSGYRGTITDKTTEDFQEYFYEKQTELFPSVPYLRGTCPWILYDFRCPRRTHYLQNYYNLKGLLNADKTHRKLAFYVMQKFYKGMKK